jgi:Domain of unknown function (DUF4160)
MPTLYRTTAFRIVVYFDDHEPSHVHVISGNGEAKVNLGPDADEIELIWVYGLDRRVIKEALGVITQNWAAYKKAWQEIHG